jgi:hypothetical protein
VVTETNVYHYDVVLHCGNAPATTPLPEALDWKKLNLEQLEAVLVERSDTFHLTGIPDARLAPALAFHQALAAGPADGEIPAIPAPPSTAVSAEDLFTLAQTHGYAAHVRWEGDGTSGLLEAVFIPAAEAVIPAWPVTIPEKPAGSLANQPRSAEDPEKSKLAASLRVHLARRLPEYMVPATFTLLDAFPMTPNGKVDRKALPSPAQAVVSTQVKEITAPRNETERALVDIWKQVLGKTDIGIHDDIFELGGDSILIFQITTRAARAGLSITPAQVFRGRTISAIAGDTTAQEPAITPSTSIQRVDRDAYRRKS